MNDQAAGEAGPVADGERLYPDRIYVVPAGLTAVVADGHLRLAEPGQIPASSNEEHQSINEELQSANEELQTVNGELAHRIGELARANRDLRNLLESTQIATLFLDTELRVKSFTPSMSEVFPLIESDLGRPIAHIASRLPYPELGEDARRVLRTLASTEREIGTPDRGRYLVRVLPYRSVDNLIAGAVLTFLDITETTVAQAARKAAEERARMATAAARIIIWEMDVESGRFSHSEGFESTFGFPPPETLEALLEAAHPEGRHRLAAGFEGAISGRMPMDLEVRMAGQPGPIWVRFSGARTGDALLGVMQDVNERRRAAGQQSLLLAELQHRVKNILAVVRSLTARSLDTSETLEQFGERFSGRIDALARTQAVLANRGAAGVRLDELVRDELATSLRDDPGQVTIGGPPVLLKDKVAEAFALAIHELATNAMKYGALSIPAGRLGVQWRIMDTGNGGRLALEWREGGLRLPGSQPARSGFGRRLIERGLPYDLEAATSLEFTPDGVRCTVELPLGPRVIALAEDEMAGPGAAPAGIPG